MDFVKPPWSLRKSLKGIVRSLFDAAVVFGIIWLVARLFGFHISNKWLLIGVLCGAGAKRPIMYLLKH